MAGSIALALMIYTATRRHKSELMKTFVFIMASLSIWSFGYVLELWSNDISISILLAKIEYIGIMTLPVGWLAFAFQYSGIKKAVTRRNMAILSAVPFINLIICWTNYHHLFYKSVEMGTGVISPLVPVYGPAFWINILYSYSLIFAGIYLFLKKAIELGRKYTKQGIILAAGVMIPIIGNVIYLSGVSPLPPGYDITPLLFVFTGIILLWLIFFFGFLDIIPIAYRTIFENISDAVIVTDDSGKIVTFNDAGRRFISPRKRGASMEGILPPEILEREKFSGKAEVRRRGKYYDVLVSPIYDGSNNFVGKAVILRDITERKKSEEQINQLNETLRIINKIMRHDILNDLQIARSSLELYLEEKDRKFLDTVFSRMDKSIKLIEKMRQLEMLLSSGKELREYDMKEVINSVMENYELEFKIKGNCTIKADEAIHSVIDNIVRNAVVHSGTDKIDITMKGNNEECEIRIADYGKGIPDEIKEKIFDERFKHGDMGGSGLGLYIVRKTIERYGGSIHVENNEPNGTVFVIKLRNKL